MRLRLLVSKEAEQQIRTAAQWWNANRPAARGLLRQELTQAFELITTQPGTGTRAFDASIAGVHRIYLIRVRYNLYYREKSEAVEVLAFWHASRGEGPPI